MKHVVVVGAGQGGLSAAIHLRLKGHHVLILEKGERPGGKAQRIDIGGYSLDPGPSIVILTRIYADVFRSAGRNVDDYLRFRRLDPFTRVFFEGIEPIDLPASRGSCLEVLGEVVPEDIESIKRLLGTLDQASKHIDRSVFSKPYHSPLQLADPHLIAMGARFDPRRTYKELVDSWFKSPLLRSFFYGFPSYGGQTYDSKAPGALMIPYLMIQEGIWYPEGGVSAIPEAFEKLALELGVEIRYKADVVQLVSIGKKVTAAVLKGGERIEADTYVSNVDYLTSQRWLGHREDLEPSLSYFTVHWGVRSRLEQLEHHTLLVPASFEKGFEQLYRQRQFPEEPIVYVNKTDAAPEGKSNLFAVVTSPARVKGIDWSDGRYLARTQQMLERFGIAVGETDFERIQTPVTFEERDGNYKGSLYGPDEKNRLFGLFPHRLTDENYRNLFYVGGSVQPGAGLPMVTLSGQFVAELI